MFSKETEMKKLKNVALAVFGLTILISTINVQAAAQFGMRRYFAGTMPSVGLQAVSSSRLFEAVRFSSSKASSRQTYGIATYDALFKWVLDDNSIRPSFFNAFIPGLPIQSSKRLDDHMNPVQELQLLRTFLHSEDTQKTVKSITGVSGLHVARNTKGHPLKKDAQATDFLHEIIGKFDDIKNAFPKVRYDGTMDFVCRLKNGEYAMVEMQVIPQDCWDRRALAYVAAFYGNQLRKGQEWKNIKKVIGINILGGGKNALPHWKETPYQFVRHYKFQEQLHNHTKFIDGMELWQYSIMNAPRSFSGNEREKQDWITFLKNGHHMTEDQVKKQIETVAVKKAFERARISKMPSAVQQAYEAEDKEYDRFSEHTAEKKAEGKIEGKIEMLIDEKLTNKQILHKLKPKHLGVTLEQIKKIRADVLLAD